MNAFTQARQAVRDTIAQALAMTFVDGYIEGPIRDFDLGATWPVGVVANAQDENYAIVQVAVRVCLAFVPPDAETGPTDPSGLEDVAAAVQIALSTNSAGLLGAYIIRTPTIEFDAPKSDVTFGVEVELENPYTAG